MNRFLLFALSLGALCLLGSGCVAAAEVTRDLINSEVFGSFLRGTIASTIEANTDLSGTETAMLASVGATLTRSAIAKPLEWFIGGKMGGDAPAV